MKKVLIQFIKDNKLTFKGTGSSLNSDCVVLCGFALYIGATVENCRDAVPTKGINVTDVCAEIERVYDYAERNNYGDYWKNGVAKASFKYELV
tara:strand:+ start:25914 stop:26192 length:279 start_codon:yes stop_codon:yes gene_type:complete